MQELQVGIDAPKSRTRDHLLSSVNIPEILRGRPQEEEPCDSHLEEFFVLEIPWQFREQSSSIDPNILNTVRKPARRRPPKNPFKKRPKKTTSTGQGTEINQ